LNSSNRAGGQIGVGRPCLIVNPLSYRAARGSLLRQAEQLAKLHGVTLIQSSTLVGFRATLDQLRACGEQRLFILAGDGTAHAVAEYLSELPHDDWSPELLFLAGGRANVVPRHCGGYPAIPALERALVAVSAGCGMTLETLPLLRIEQVGQPPRHGFFFAGAMIDAGIRVCSAHRAAGSGWLHRSWVADPYALLKLGLKVISGNSPLPAYAHTQVTCSDGARLHAPLRVLLASTMPMHQALYDPFADRGTGALRLTAIAATAQQFWRRLPKTLRGAYDAEMSVEHGYLSGRFDCAQVTGLDGYSLDGEPSATPGGQQVSLGCGVPLRLLRL
jgi:hypothetical protein